MLWSEGTIGPRAFPIIKSSPEEGRPTVFLAEQNYNGSSFSPLPETYLEIWQRVDYFEHWRNSEGDGPT